MTVHPSETTSQSAYLTGYWKFYQQNGGPTELDMHVDDNGQITLKLGTDELKYTTGAVYASGKNPDGDNPVLMTLYSKSASAAMGLSITNFSGVVSKESSSIPIEMTGTAIGTLDVNNPSNYKEKEYVAPTLALYSWYATRVTDSE